MNKVRNFSAALLLIGTLSLPTLAGQIEIGSPQPDPTSTPAACENSTSTNGNIHTGDTDDVTAADAVAEAALSLLQGVLSLL